MKLLVIACKEKDERAFPYVVGAFNQELMDALDQEDYDKQINALKKTWTLDPLYYDWREFYIEIDDEEIEKLFETKTLEGYWSEASVEKHKVHICETILLGGADDLLDSISTAVKERRRLIDG